MVLRQPAEGGRMRDVDLIADEIHEAIAARGSLDQ